jgi:type I restriction enzyme S subunit
MNNGWKTKPLGELCDILDSQRKPITKRDRVVGEYPYFGATGIVDYVSDFIFDEPLVLVGEDGAKWASGESTAFAVDGKCWVNNHAHVLRPHRQTVLDSWLVHYLQHSDLSEFVSGLTVPKLNQGNLREIPIPLAPLAEQQRIVGILDEAFEGIATAKANAEKNLQNARALFESHLQTVFTQRGEGWVQKTLEEIASTFGRGKSRHRPRNAPHLYGGPYPFVQTGDIRNADHVITEYSQTYSEAGLAQSRLWPKGTIGITIAANIAETAILGFDACFPDSVIGVVANPKQADVGFIEYLLRSFKARLQAMGKGSAQANINMGTFENERFPFPSVAEQKTIVAELDGLSEETQRLATIYERKLAALDDLKKSLLHQAFSGNL